MKKTFRLIFFVLVTVVFVCLFSGCGEVTTPYDENDSEGYTVSVKYDANGGTFTTNTSVIVDSFNTSKSQIALIAPDSEQRNKDAFSATKNGYFLAGWYKERTQKTDDNGNTYFEYSQKWDFDKDLLTIDKNKHYSSKEPELTLYAAWVPLFEIEFYSIDTGDLIDTLKFDPTSENEFLLPVWDDETGALEMYDFPKREGYTYNRAYLNADATDEVIGEKLVHPGSVNSQDATASDSVLKLYVDWTEGEWYRIYNVDQFKESANLSGNYELFSDLDFSDEIWPTTFVYGNFTGSIKGNGHTIKNVEITQTNNSKVNAGLFGYLTDTSNITDVNFENITFTIKAGTRKVGTNYGLFAGTIADEASVSGVNILNSHLQIDSSSYFAVDDYSIGLICGMGDVSKIDSAQVDCNVVGNDPEKIDITLNDNDVIVDFKK